MTEHFTGVPGRKVSIRETIEGVAAILDGGCDDLPEDRLFMIGPLSEVLRA